MKLIALIKLGRPTFLGGGFVLYAIGAAVAAAFGHRIDVARYALGQAAITSFQWMTHYANEYFDYDADLANATPTRWSGGSRVLVAGELPRAVALITALALAATGIGFAIALVDVAPFVAPTFVLVLVLAWEYSAPPLRLCATGFGELDTAIVVTVLVPWVGFSLQAPELTGGTQLALTIVPLALLQFAMLIAIEFPDRASDAATGKRTLVVRLGVRASARLYIAVTALAYVWPSLAAVFGGLPATVALAMTLPAPLALWRIARIRDHADPSAYERLTFWSVALLVITALTALVAWAIRA